MNNFAELAAREVSLIVASAGVADVYSLFEEFKRRGAEIAQAPTKQPWGGTDLHVRDPDGNVIAFVAPTDEAGCPPNPLLRPQIHPNTASSLARSKPATCLAIRRRITFERGSGTRAAKLGTRLAVCLSRVAGTTT